MVRVVSIFSLDVHRPVTTVAHAVPCEMPLQHGGFRRVLCIEAFYTFAPARASPSTRRRHAIVLREAQSPKQRFHGLTDARTRYVMVRVEDALRGLFVH